MGFSRQEYWSGVPLPSPRVEAGHLQIPISLSYFYWRVHQRNCYTSMRTTGGAASLANSLGSVNLEKSIINGKNVQTLRLLNT